MPRRLPAPSNPWRLLGASMAERLAVARDDTSTAVELTVIAPPGQDARYDQDLTELVVALLQHPSLPAAVASRWVGHPDVEVRRLVLDVPGLPGTTLEALTHDRDAEIAGEARALLAAI